MEFTLVYRGSLKVNGDAKEKQAIRRAIHTQMKNLWDQKPLANIKDEWINKEKAAPEDYLGKELGEFTFIPFVSEKLFIVAELTISFLRPEEPGSIITQGGDIDNRIKTLLDALRMPKIPNEVPKGDVPRVDENPFFCLLEDDNLITKLTVSTDRLLEPVESRSEVQLLMHVLIKRTRGTWGNINLG